MNRTLWEWLLVELIWVCTGGLIGYMFARLLRWRTRGRVNVRYVRPRCLQVGHKWQRIDPCIPIQFCDRYKCMGARVAPMHIEHMPLELVTELELALDENAALSQDRTP